MLSTALKAPAGLTFLILPACPVHMPYLLSRQPIDKAAHALPTE